MTIEQRMMTQRLSLGLTQKQVSEATGISRATLCRAEKGSLRLSGPNRDKAEAWLGQAERGEQG